MVIMVMMLIMVIMVIMRLRRQRNREACVAAVATVCILSSQDRQLGEAIVCGWHKEQWRKCLLIALVLAGLRGKGEVAHHAKQGMQAVSLIDKAHKAAQD